MGLHLRGGWDVHPLLHGHRPRRQSGHPQPLPRPPTLQLFRHGRRYVRPPLERKTIFYVFQLQILRKYYYFFQNLDRKDLFVYFLKSLMIFAKRLIFVHIFSNTLSIRNIYYMYLAIDNFECIQILPDITVNFKHI